MASYPIPYNPRPQPSLGADWQTYVRRELLDLKDTLDGITSMLPQDATAAPFRPQHGMIRMSRSPWRPVGGQTVDKWVIYDALAATWSYVN